MPNRVIKDSIFTSDKISTLSDFEFRLWIGLITSVEDAGRGDARPAIIKGRVFPLRDRVSLKDIDAAVHGLAAKGCVSLYTVGGKPYFWFPTWSKHQRIRDVRPKYPAPEEADELQHTDADFLGLPQSAADCGGLRPESNPIQSESELKSESNPKLGDAPACAGRFRPPTLEEVSAYVVERGSAVNPQEFIDFYASKGWMVGKSPMKDWKAACRNAEKWDRWSDARAKAKTAGAMPGQSTQPSKERIQKNADWLDAFLSAQQEGEA